MNKPYNKKRKVKTLIFLLLSAGFVIICLQLSGALVKRHIAADENVAIEADESYYLASKSKLAQNASKNLSYADRIKIVSGSWASSYKECSTTSGTLTEAEAVRLAKQQMEYFHQARVYPYSLMSTYDNWYSFDTKLYEYTETTFNTYTVYLWCITFTKYDNSLTHTILMTENGTIVNAEASSLFSEDVSIVNAYLTDDKSFDLSDLMGNPSLSLMEYKNDIDIVSIPYPNIDTGSLYLTRRLNIKIYQEHKSTDDFVIYQYKTANSYGIGIIPK